MVKDAPCAKCGSAKVVPRARLIERGHGGGDADSIRLGVARRPEALLFKREEVADVHARVFGDCGFTELYVEGADLVYRAYQDSLQGHE